jgi:hypothetical protein
MQKVYKLIALSMCVLGLAACGGGTEPEPTVAPPVTVAANPTAAPAEPTAAPVEPTAVTEPSKDAAVEPTAAQADVETAAPSGGAAYDAVISAMRGQFSGGPYRAVATTETAGSTTIMTSEVIPPDSMHIVITGDGESTEVISVGGAMWTRTGDSEWTALPGGEMMKDMIESMLANVDGSLVSNVQLVGPEVLDGEATTVYTYSSSLGEGESAITSENKLWIADASGLPIKLESNGSAMGIANHIVQTIEYDDRITIEAPVQ